MLSPVYSTSIIAARIWKGEGMAKTEKIECMKQLYMRLNPQQRRHIARIASRLHGAKFALTESQQSLKKSN